MRVPPPIFPIVHLDGAYLPAAEARVSVFDRGLLVADGVFDTVSVEAGVPLALDRHLARLARSAAFMRLTVPGGSAGARQVLETLLARNGLDRRDAPPAAARFTLTRGSVLAGPPTWLVFLRRVPPEHLAKREDGVALFTLPLHGRGASDLAEHKTLSHLPSSLGQVLLAERAGGAPAEGVFVDETGAVLEGTASNVFAVVGGELITPPLSAGILRGTARAAAMEAAERLRWVVRRERLPLRALAAAEEAFITSSTLRIAPAVRLDDGPIGAGEPGPRTRALQAALDARTAAAIAAWYAARAGGSPGSGG